jgi:hypothetical protein
VDYYFRPGANRNLIAIGHRCANSRQNVGAIKLRAVCGTQIEKQKLPVFFPEQLGMPV